MWYMLALLALVAVGCSEPSSRSPGDPAQETVSVRDSAGITLRTDPRTLEELPVFARLSDEPAVVLGRDESVSAELFGNVGDIAAHPEHGIAVADSEALDVRVFDWTGRHRGSFGGPGEGPGDFGSIAVLEGDSTLWAWDRRRGRISAFDWSGALLRDFNVDRSGMPWGGVVTLAASGHAVIGRHILARPSDEPGYHLRPDSLELEIVDSTGAPVASLGRISATERVFLLEPFELGNLATNFLRPLGGTRFVETLGDVVLLARGDDPELYLFDLDGTLREIRRFPGLVRAANPEFVDAWVTRRAESGDGFDARTRAEFLAEFPPETLPAFVDLVVSGTGSVWLASVSTSERRTWVVVSEDGSLEGRVDVPAELDVRTVTSERLVGVVTDELDVERVRIYDLAEGGG